MSKTGYVKVKPWMKDDSGAIVDSPELRALLDEVAAELAAGAKITGQTHGRLPAEKIDGVLWHDRIFVTVTVKE